MQMAQEKGNMTKPDQIMCVSSFVTCLPPTTAQLQERPRSTCSRQGPKRNLQRKDQGKTSLRSACKAKDWVAVSNILLPHLQKFCPIPIVNRPNRNLSHFDKWIWTEQNKAARQPKRPGSPCEVPGHAGSQEVKTRRSWWPTGHDWGPTQCLLADTHLLVQQPGKGSTGHKAGLGCSSNYVHTEGHGCCKKNRTPTPSVAFIHHLLRLARPCTLLHVLGSAS